MTILLLVGPIGGFACAKPQRWEVREQPSVVEAGILLQQADPQAVRRDYLFDELPDVPVRERLRPCCAFGSNLKPQVAGIPVLGYKIANIISSDEMGPHTYDSGYVHVPRGGASQYSINRENNGLVYTCRGGFIDTAHVRDYIDWSLYVSSQVAAGLLSGARHEFTLPDEGGKRRIIVNQIDPELIRRIGARRLSLWLAEWITWKMSVWHEISTWYGFATVPGFTEEGSAFSPEDLYSNALGVRLLPAIIYRHAERSELDYNSSVDQWLRQIVEFLQPVPKDVGFEASEAVDKLWWDSDAGTPSKQQVLRRSMDFEGEIEPWLVPASRMPAALRENCGDAPDPQVLNAPEGYSGVDFGQLITLEIEVNDDIASRHPFTETGRTITQSDFPRLVEAVRKQNRAEFGDDADRPD